MNELKIVSRDVGDLRMYPGNAKEHPAWQIKDIMASITQFGFNDPIAVDADDFVIEGHGRLMAAKELGLQEVPVISLSHMTEAEVKAYIIAHNQLTMSTDFNMDVLASEIDSILEAGEFDVSVLGFTAEEMDEILNTGEDDAPLDEDEGDALGDAGNLKGVFGLRDTLDLPAEEKAGMYNFPIIRGDMLAEPHDDYTVWIGAHRTTDGGGPLWYLFGSDSTRGMDATRTTIAFYVDDQRFERVWNNLPKYAEKFLTAKIEAVVMPNFSMWPHMSKAERIWNAYRSRYIARYFQEAGLRVIPDLAFAIGDDFEFIFDGMPEAPPALSLQIQHFSGGTSSDDADDIRHFVGLALDRIRPLHLIVYAGERGLRLGREIAERHGVKFIGVLNRSAHMRGDVAKTEEQGVI